MIGSRKRGPVGIIEFVDTVLPCKFFCDALNLVATISLKCTCLVVMYQMIKDFVTCGSILQLQPWLVVP